MSKSTRDKGKHLSRFAIQGTESKILKPFSQWAQAHETTLLCFLLIHHFWENGFHHLGFLILKFLSLISQSITCAQLKNGLKDKKRENRKFQKHIERKNPDPYSRHTCLLASSTVLHKQLAPGAGRKPHPHSQQIPD